MIKLTEKLYEQSIPKCCSYQTMKEHLDFMLCWQLADRLEKGKKMDCDHCDFKVPAND